MSGSASDDPGTGFGYRHAALCAEDKQAAEVQAQTEQRAAELRERTARSAADELEKTERRIWEMRVEANKQEAAMREQATAVPRGQASEVKSWRYIGKSMLWTVVIGLGSSMVLSAAFVLISVLVMTANCETSSQFDPYVGPVKFPPEPIAEQGKFQGRGGTRTVVDGVSFWSSGAPPCEYEALGSLTWSGETGMGWMESVAVKVKAVGGTSLLIHDVSVDSEAPAQPAIARVIAYASSVASMSAEKAPEPDRRTVLREHNWTQRVATMLDTVGLPIGDIEKPNVKIVERPVTHLRWGDRHAR